MFDAALQHIAMRWHTNSLLERPREVVYRQAG
jgi:hypothetical protein